MEISRVTSTSTEVSGLLPTTTLEECIIAPTETMEKKSMPPLSEHEEAAPSTPKVPDVPTEEIPSSNTCLPPYSSLPGVYLSTICFC